MDRIRALIRGYEGKSKHVYLDSEGNWTVGCGHFLTDEERLNVLTHPLWSDREIEVLFEHDFKTALEDFAAVFGQQEMAEARRAALVDMLFNLGPLKISQVCRHDSSRAPWRLGTGREGMPGQSTGTQTQGPISRERRDVADRRMARCRRAPMNSPAETSLLFVTTGVRCSCFRSRAARGSRALFSGGHAARNPAAM